jgi:NADPH:quinone reductase
VKALQIDHFGPLADLQVRDVPTAAPAPESVRIRVEAAGVNPSDVGVALGRFPQTVLPRILGRDFAGTVAAGPTGMIGTPVWGSGGGELGITRDGSHAEYLVLPASAAIRRPPHLTAEEAAVAGVPFVTAWSALVELAGFAAGEWALISGAAGAVGSAAVQLTTILGGKTIAVVRDSDDLTPLEGLPVAGVLRSDRDDVAAEVRKLTSGRGVDVALNGVGASIFAPLFDSLASDGRLVVFSARSGRDSQLDLFALYRRRLRIIGLDTAALSLAEAARRFARFGEYFESKRLKAPPIAARFSLSDAREAYECVERGIAGKVVLVPES